MQKLLFLLLCSYCCALGSAGQNRIVLLKSFDTLAVSGEPRADAAALFTLISQAPVGMSSKKEKANNCENRAELAYHILAAYGYKPVNFWLFKEGLVEPGYSNRDAVTRSKGLAFNTGIGKQPYVFWHFHVATGIVYHGDTLIFDPWTQGKLVSLRQWALSFYKEAQGRTAYLFPVRGQYSYFGSTAKGQMNPDKAAWLPNIDSNYNQMYCGLCGFRNNKECNKRKHKPVIARKKQQVDAYIRQQPGEPEILADRRTGSSGNW
jgi:hypothetical protein